MRNTIFGGVLGIILAGLFVLGFSSFYTVYETQQALVVRFGRVVNVVREPGLNFKAPFVDAVIPIDKRILDLENPPQEVIASDQKRLVVDAFMRYRITDPLKFYQRLATIQRGNTQMSTLMNSAVRRVLGESTFTRVVRDERAALTNRIREVLGREVEEFGIEVVDVRIRRADLPEQNSQAIFQRMQTERQREAAEIRAQGNEAAQRTRARADRDVTVLIADAQSQAEILRGDGDRERNAIFAAAYSKDQDFFAFYRSMIALENGLKPGETRMLLSPDGEFFRYFGDPSGKAMAPAAPVAPAR